MNNIVLFSVLFVVAAIAGAQPIGSQKNETETQVKPTFADLQKLLSKSRCFPPIQMTPYRGAKFITTRDVPPVNNGVGEQSVGDVQKIRSPRSVAPANLSKDRRFIGALAAKIGGKIAKLIGKKMAKRAGKAIIKKASRKALKKASQKLFKKAGKKIASKVNKKTMKRAGQKLMKKAAKSAAKTAQKQILKKMKKKIMKKKTTTPAPKKKLG